MPNFEQLHELIKLAKSQGYLDWAAKLERETAKLATAFNHTLTTRTEAQNDAQ